MKSSIRKNINKDINNMSISLSNPNKFNSSVDKCNLKKAAKHAKILVNTMDKNIKYCVNINNIITNLWDKAYKDPYIKNKVCKFGKDRVLSAVLIYFSSFYNSIYVPNDIHLNKISLKSHHCNDYNYRKYNKYKHCKHSHKHSHCDSHHCDHHGHHSDHHGHHSDHHGHHSDHHGHHCNDHHGHHRHHCNDHHGHDGYHHHEKIHSHSNTYSINGIVNILEHRVNCDGSNSKENSYSLSLNYELHHGKLYKKSWVVNYNHLQTCNVQNDFIDACRSKWVCNILPLI